MSHVILIVVLNVNTGLLNCCQFDNKQLKQVFSFRVLRMGFFQVRGSGCIRHFVKVFHSNLCFSAQRFVILSRAHLKRCGLFRLFNQYCVWVSVCEFSSLLQYYEIRHTYLLSKVYEVVFWQVSRAMSHS